MQKEYILYALEHVINKENLESPTFFENFIAKYTTICSFYM